MPQSLAATGVTPRGAGAHGLDCSLALDAGGAAGNAGGLDA